MKTFDIKITSSENRTCPRCRKDFPCERYENGLWAQSCCGQCLSEYERPIARRVKESGQKSYSDFDPSKLPEPARKIAKEFLDWFPVVVGQPGLGLAGVPGTGKSYLLHELARRLKARSLEVCLLDDRAVNNLVKPDGTNEKMRLLARALNCEVLVWDDFGTSKMTDSVEEFYNLLLEMIYQDKKPIVCATNFSGDQLKEQWHRQTGEASWLTVRGDKILRRLKECCLFQAIKAK